MMNGAQLKAAAFLAVLGLVFAAGLYTGARHMGFGTAAVANFSSAALPVAEVDLASFWRVWRILEEQYVPASTTGTVPTQEERVYGAIRGLVESYGDPHTVFLPPREAAEFAEEISGSFEGVGMEIGIRNGVLTIVAPLRNTPAERAGIRSGDRILAIDGEPAEHLAVHQAVRMIRGPRGSIVTITIGREGSAEPLHISIERGVIEIPTINYYLRDDGIFVIELYNFSAVSPDRFREALRSLMLSGTNKLILDLRGNPGGYLEASVEMASYFLPVGALVVVEDFGGKRENITHRSRGYNVFVRYPLRMAILVDGGSASASEILAGALAEHGVATLVGSRTFGKGSVQQLVEIGGGSELKVTVARWLTPQGISISDGGLTPSIIVERSTEDRDAGRDPQIKKAVEILLSRQAPNPNVSNSKQAPSN